MSYTYWRYFHPQRYIDNVKRERSMAVAYCVCDRHRGYLTEGLIKSHKCRTKKCEFFRDNVTWGKKPEKGDDSE